MCRMCAIFTCRRAKYFAKTMMSASCAKSAGCTANSPKSKRLCAPLTTAANRKTAARRTTMRPYTPTTTGVRRRKLYSGMLAAKNTTTATATQIICLSKNTAWSLAKECMVTRPRSAMASAEAKRNQSIWAKGRTPKSATRCVGEIMALSGGSGYRRKERQYINAPDCVRERIGPREYDLAFLPRSQAVQGGRRGSERIAGRIEYDACERRLYHTGDRRVQDGGGEPRHRSGG